MNCKPLDVAIVVRPLADGFADAPCSHRWLGMTVRVVQPIFGQLEHVTGFLLPAPVWTLEKASRCPRCHRLIEDLPDEILKPLPAAEDVAEHDAKADDGLLAEREKMLHNRVRIDDALDAGFRKWFTGEAPTSWYDNLLDDER